MAFAYMDWKRINQALEVQVHAIQNRIDKRQNMLDGKSKTANKNGKFNVASLTNKNDEDNDRIISLQSLQMKVKDELRKLEGAEVAQIRRGS